MTEEDKKFRWKSGARIKVSANDAGMVLDAIHERDGCIKPQAVVDEAKPKESPIHDAFEWRDKVAANEHRKWQARQMVRSIEIVSENRPDTNVEVTTRAFFSAGGGTNEKPTAYYSGVKVLNDKELFDRAYQDAIAKLRLSEQSVAELRKLAKESQEVDALKSLMIATEALSTASEAIRQIRH